MHGHMNVIKLSGAFHSLMLCQRLSIKDNFCHYPHTYHKPLLPLLPPNFFLLLHFYLHFKMFNFHFSRCCFKTCAPPHYKDRDLALVGFLVVLWSDNPVLKPVCWEGFRLFPDPPISELFHCCFYYHFCKCLSWMLRSVAIFCAVAFILQYMRPENCEIIDGNICLCALVGKSGSYMQWNHSCVTWPAAPRITWAASFLCRSR